MHSYQNLYDHPDQTVKQRVQEKAESLHKFKEAQANLRAAWTSYLTNKAEQLENKGHGAIKESNSQASFQAFQHKRNTLIDIY